VPHVVIVGAGFAGLHAARALRKADVRVTVLDRANHHLFQPMLYQVATALLNPADISTPIRRLIEGKNVTVLMSEVRRVDAAQKRVVCDIGEVAYDELIIASGATHSYFGHDDWARHAPGLKTIDDALDIRRRLLLAFERAEPEPDAARRAALTTFVLIGGGPTGVELAGALADMTRYTLSGEYKAVDPRNARIVLLEALPHLLNAWPEPLPARARRKLEQRGVEVRTNSMVTHVDARGVTYSPIDERGVKQPEQRIASETVLWGAGVQASPLGRSLNAPTDRAGHVKVTPFLSVPGHDDVFVVGDLASVHSEGKPVPGLAAGALQMGRHAANNILRKRRGAPMLPFHYRDRGSLAVIGRGAAVGILFARLRVYGVLAWLLWLAVHLFYLTGLRNKLEVSVSWLYYLVTRERPNRLITGVYGLSNAAPPAQRELTRTGAQGQGPVMREKSFPPWH